MSGGAACDRRPADPIRARRPGRRFGVVKPAEARGLPAILRYVLSMFAHAHQALMMALLPGPVGVR